MHKFSSLVCRVEGGVAEDRVAVSLTSDTGTGIAHTLVRDRLAAPFDEFGKN
jgi:hypothetical protein